MASDFKGKKNSRTTNTIYNFISSVGGQALIIIMQFVVRTVFIQTLGKSYLGISGLFSNILSMLSLAELGVGNAILFKLYEPIARNDYSKIRALLDFYKRIYKIIGIFVAIVGVCLIPFLPYLIEDYQTLVDLRINTVFIFLLYLLQNVSSYFFWAYKSAIVKGNQKEYVLNIVKNAFTIGSSLLQIGLLLLYPNFEMYVAVLVVSVIGENIAYALIANKMYPYITEKTTQRLPQHEKKEIYKDCGALAFYKVNEVVIKATDNVVLSICLGLKSVAVYSNYYVFYTTIKTLFEKVFSSVAHSLGNLHTTHDTKREYEVFETINLICAMLAGTAFVGLFVVADEFVLAWIGQDWVIPQPFSLLLGMEVYTMAIRKVLGKYRNSMGLFQQAKYRPLAGMLVNLIASVVLVNVWGINGVLAGTIIADWTTFMWFDPIIIHKYGFENKYSVLRYYLKTLKYLLICSCVAAIDWFVCAHLFVGMGWLSVICHACICAITVPLALLVATAKTQEGKQVRAIAKRYLNKITKKLKR